mgnify:CR=1 FL=1
MTRYSIRKLGSEYVVLADDQCILKFTSRRKAERKVSGDWKPHCPATSGSGMEVVSSSSLARAARSLGSSKA